MADRWVAGPAPEVTADTHFTDPNYWIGIGSTF
jgi:hypothetical protein